MTSALAELDKQKMETFEKTLVADRPNAMMNFSLEFKNSYIVLEDNSRTLEDNDKVLIFKLSGNVNVEQKSLWRDLSWYDKN